MGPSGFLNYSYSSFAQSDFHQTDVVEQQTKRLDSRDDMFYSWECVSLVIGSYTVAFVIKDPAHMMYFLHILQHKTM